MTAKPEDLRLVVLGGGAIGAGIAAAAADAGAAVALIEPDPEARAALPVRLAAEFPDMQAAGLARGDARAALARIAIHARLEEATPGASLVIEAGPERVEAKRAIFRAVCAWAGAGVPVATASSALTVAEIVEDPAERAWCLNAHPLNPPSILRVIECVPAPETLPEAMDSAADTLSACGFTPVALGHAVPAFVANRLQAAMLREAYRLVAEGVIDAPALDRLVSEGLGPRWALSGPFETAELNTPGGIRGHAARMGPAYAAIGRARGEHDVDWPGALVDTVAAQRAAVLPEARRDARRAWRRRALARLIAARRPILEDWETGDG